MCGKVKISLTTILNKAKDEEISAITQIISVFNDVLKK